MIEYEYSFKVNSLEKYLQYCKNNDYVLEKNALEKRVLYKNPNKILARISTTYLDNKESSILDFKDDQEDNLLKTSRESIPLKINKENMSSILSMLDILNFKEDKTLERNRIIYKKGKVKFEIDQYIKPEKCFVVAIEGEKKFVDKVYEDIKKLG